MLLLVASVRVNRVRILNPENTPQLTDSKTNRTIFGIELIDLYGDFFGDSFAMARRTDWLKHNWLCVADSTG
jgi:hypothetical protein